MLQKLKKSNFSKIKVKTIPKSPGVYLFFDDTDVIYVGKSINLKNRISSYLSNDLYQKTKMMISEVKYFSIIQTTSELEALLLESKLIKRFKPKFNIQLKDDKNPLYIRISKEKYPRVLVARKIDQKEKNISFYGPFPSSKNVRTVLTIVRRIFPFSQHKIGSRPCFYSQIGLCNPCPNEIENKTNEKDKKKIRAEYLKSIKYIKKFLDGDLVKIKKLLEKSMKLLAKKENFEEAEIIKRRLSQIAYISQPIIQVSNFIENPNLYTDIRRMELEKLKYILNKFVKIKKLNRIECFDIAHLSGIHPTASMVTFLNGETDRSLYRHFNIYQKKSSSDTDSMEEVGFRRNKNISKWGKPDLIIVDGGKGQVTSFKKGFNNKYIPVIGLTKRYETLVIPENVNGNIIWHQKRLEKGHAKDLVIRLRDEAHRFARRLHHKKFEKELLAS